MNNSLPTAKKSNKKFLKTEYILCVFLIVIVIIIFFTNSGLLNIFNNKSSENSSNYAELLENKLQNLISNINGVGEVDIVISVDGSSLKEYLKNSQTKIENGVKIIEETTVLINGKPYLIKEHNPIVTGIVIVCKNGDNLQKKMEITEVITTLIDISSENILILKKK